MSKMRLDELLLARKMVQSRSQAANLIKLGKVQVNNKHITKPGVLVGQADSVQLDGDYLYVSRAGYKLASAAQIFKTDFTNKVVLDVGSSTGGFTDYALQHGAKKVIAVDVGTNQLHPSLHGNPIIELHEKTDIRDFATTQHIDIIVMDVSFISARDIVPHLKQFMNKNTILIAMIKPQFEAQKTGVKHKGVIKNAAMRRKVLAEFENWVKNEFTLTDKADSKVAGAKGNIERFYVLKLLK